MSLASCRRVVAAVVLGVSALTPAHAGTVSYTGDFTADDDRFVVAFDWTGSDLFTARTYSYGGGVNAAAHAIAAGGFAPVLALFDRAGLLLQSVAGSTSTCGDGVGAADPATGDCWDAGFATRLVAGSYVLILTQDGNAPNGPFLADGYAQDGRSTYTGSDFAGDDRRRFVGATGEQRDGHWALDVSGEAAPRTVPEPLPGTLIVAGLALLSRRRRRTASPPRRL